MRIGDATVVHDLYQWLPAYGESNVLFYSQGADLVLEVEYEKDHYSGVRVAKIKMVFSFAAYFCKSPFPGEGLVELDWGKEKVSMGSLVELRESEALRRANNSWADVSVGEGSGLRHFYVAFLSENVSFHVISEDVRVSEERT